MPKKPPHTFFYRAFFKPKTLDVFEGFSSGDDTDDPSLGYTQAYHRSNWSGSPFAVYNEYVCAELGRFIRLPIAPFAITYKETSAGYEPMFSSLDFNFNRQKLPPVLPDLCVEYQPQLCAGVLAFDIFIANEDRHDKNLLVDKVSKPRAIHVFDHDQAFLGGCQSQGLERFAKLKDRLGITGGPVTGGNAHIFLPHITSYKHLMHWVQRIHEIPDWFVRTVCREAQAYGLDKT